MFAEIRHKKKKKLKLLCGSNMLKKFAEEIAIICYNAEF